MNIHTVIENNFTQETSLIDVLLATLSDNIEYNGFIKTTIDNILEDMENDLDERKQ